jgi:hypothetical protein
VCTVNPVAHPLVQVESSKTSERGTYERPAPPVPRAARDFLPAPTTRTRPHPTRADAGACLHPYRYPPSTMRFVRLLRPGHSFLIRCTVPHDEWGWGWGWEVSDVEVMGGGSPGYAKKPRMRCTMTLGFGAGGSRCRRRRNASLWKGQTAGRAKTSVTVPAYTSQQALHVWDGRMILFHFVQFVWHFGV